MNPILEHFLKFILVVAVGYAAGVNAFLTVGSQNFQEEASSSQLMELLLSFAFATVLIFILLKYKIPLLLRLIEAASLFALSYVLAYLLSFNPTVAMAFATLSTLLRISWSGFVEVAPLIMAAGGSAFFGVAIPLNILVLFSLILIVYDFVSVFITKHMVEMAVNAEKAGLAMSISSKKLVSKGKVKRVSGISMGLGDVVFPTAIAISAFPISSTLSTALLVAIPIGYVLVLYTLSKLRMPIPALPPMLAPQIAVLAAFVASTFI